MFRHINGVHDEQKMEPVAIIGLSGRFPGAENIREYWQLLCNSVDAITEVPADRWDAHQLYDPDLAAPGKINTRWGGFLRQVDQFDPLFFGISPRETVQMDPQQRLMLELAWEALADAGQDVEALRESDTAVFFGASWADYATLHHKNDLEYIAQHTATGTHFSIIANRVSYAFGFRGPSMTIDTACSSSLVAIHQACISLRSGESTLALAGGVHLMLAPDSTLMMSKFGGLSPDGRCRTFDAHANGFVRGEGGGVVVLKMLSQALADHDPIYCVIQGSAVNNDGRETGLSAMQRIVTAARTIRHRRRETKQINTGLTVPNTAAQEAVLRAACRRAGLSPEKVQYVEAHGTGTPLGDPIEAKALSAIYCAGREETRPLLLGSVKTNIGHLEAAAGVAGLIKVALAIKEGLIPANLHFAQPNPNIPFETLKLKVPTAVTPWPDPDEPPVAGISSFGFGGTNCHILLAGLPPQMENNLPEPVAAPALLLPLSARTAEARQETAQTLLSFLQTHPDLSLSDLCYTASRRATHHPYRLAVAFTGQAGLMTKLEAFVRGEEVSGVRAEEAAYMLLPPPVFVFSGQGPQWWAMGRELYAQEPVYRAVIEQCDRLLRAHADWSLIDELMAEENHSRLEQTAVAQPALFAVQIALAALWQSWGIEPGAVVGHSVGEVAAAYVAGSLTLEQAIQVIYHRGQLMQAATGLGKMAAVDLSLDKARHLLNGYADRLAIAAVNGPEAITLSGDAATLENFLSHLDEAGIFYRRLPVDYAFHSPQMAPFQAELEQVLAGLSPQTAVIPIFSTVTGQAVNGLELDAAYWGRNLRQTVWFDEAVQVLAEQGFSTFIEISPHPVLGGYISQRLAANQKTGHVLPSLRRKQPDRKTMLASLGALYTLGYALQWSSLYPGGEVVHLPPYPWQRERYWLESGNGRATPSRTPYPADEKLHPWLGYQLRSPLLGRAVVFETAVTLTSHPFLDDHRLYGEVVAPGAHHLSMILSAVRAHLGTDACQLTDITFTHALTLSTAGRVVQVILSPDGPEKYTFAIHSRPAAKAGEWQLHASGQVTVGAIAPAAPTPDGQTIQTRCPEKLAGEVFYKDFAAAGYNLGPRFQWLQQIWRRDGEAICQIRPPQPADQAEMFQLPPGLIDSLFQFLCTTLPGGGVTHILRTGDIYIPLGIDGFRFNARFNGRVPDALWCHARLHPQDNSNDQTFSGDITLFAASGAMVAEVTGLHFKRAPRDILLRPVEAEPAAWMYQMQWSASPVATPALPPADNWLLFGHDNAFSQKLVDTLTAQGQRCLVVTPGDSLQTRDDGQWHLNPAQPDDFAQLLAVIEAEKLDHVVYLWGLETTPADSLAQMEAVQNLAGQGALHLVQALARLESEHTPRLWLVTQGAQPVTAEDNSMALAQAPLWGLGRVVALEHPEIWGGLVDLESGQPDTAVILSHILAADGEDQAAFRQGQRYVARLVRAQRSQHDVLDITIRDDGAYLITGGLGGLGLTLARWLAEQGARHLVLVGRRGVTAEAQAAITAIEQMGTAVTVLAADITQAEQVTAVLSHIQANMPPLRGIIHAAGVLHDGILLHQEWGHFTQVMAPKVAGAWHLHTQTSKQPLDFFIFFSSISSLMGSAGQGNYAAANAFMDALSHARRLQGLPALSINWGPWAGVGMATALSDAQKQHWLGQGIGVIPPTQGIALLHRALEQGASQVGIFPINWDAFAQQTSLRHNWPFFAEFTRSARQNTDDAPPQAAQFWRELEQTPPVKQKELLLGHVQQQAVQVLGIGSARRLDPHRRLFEMGMDSLMAVELQKRLQAGLNARLSKTVVFDYPTVQSLTNYLARQVLRLEVTDTAVTSEVDLTDELQAEIAGLSEEEAEALLLAELGG
ncbi:MAG: type I polyketide synthase [Anaerolineae bacterium]|nr:type I polyketide synthase [Anaerolineae bacterium]